MIVLDSTDFLRACAVAARIVPAAERVAPALGRARIRPIEGGIEISASRGKLGVTVALAAVPGAHVPGADEGRFLYEEVAVDAATLYAVAQGLPAGPVAVGRTSGSAASPWHTRPALRVCYGTRSGRGHADLVAWDADDTPDARRARCGPDAAELPADCVERAGGLIGALVPRSVNEWATGLWIDPRGRLAAITPAWASVDADFAPADARCVPVDWLKFARHAVARFAPAVPQVRADAATIEVTVGGLTLGAALVQSDVPDVRDVLKQAVPPAPRAVDFAAVRAQVGAVREGTRARELRLRADAGAVSLTAASSRGSVVTRVEEAVPSDDAPAWFGATRALSALLASLDGAGELGVCGSGDAAQLSLRSPSRSAVIAALRDDGDAVGSVDGAENGNAVAEGDAA